MNKKKQKNFINLDRYVETARGPEDQKVFWFFFFKKEPLAAFERDGARACTTLANRWPIGHSCDLMSQRNNNGTPMRRSFNLPIVLTAALAACTVAPPSGPSVTALPGPGKSLPQFQQDDDNCRGYAAGRTQNAPQDAAAASNNANATAVAGTLIGAAAGAALGSLSGNAGTGAAVGAGAGLLAGASSAGGQAQDAADSLQQQYDTAYEQCMVGNGEALNGPPPVGYDSGPDPDDAIVPAAIATGAAAAIILSTRPDDDGGYRPDDRGDYPDGNHNDDRPNAPQAIDRPADHQRPNGAAPATRENPVQAAVPAALAPTPAIATPAVDDPTKHKDRKKKSS